MTVITATRAIQLLEHALEKKGPDYLYQVPDTASDCVYAAAGVPSCLIGYALHEVGGDTLLEDFEGSAYNDEPISSPAVVQLLTEHDIELTSGALNVFRSAQLAQDSQRTWGTAVRKARTYYENLDDRE